MKNHYLKSNNYVSKTLLLLFFVTLFLGPKSALAGYDVSSMISTAKGFGYDTSQIETYLSAGQKAGIDLSSTDKIKSYLNNEVRNTAKAGFDLTRAGFNTIINGPDSLLGFDMTSKKQAAREGLAQLDLAEKQTNDKINNTLGQVNKAESMYGLINTVGKIPQVLGLIDDIKALGKGGANPAQAIATLEKIGGIVGFTVPADLKQGLGMLSGMSGGMEGAASTLQGLLGGAGGLTNRSAGMISGVTGAASGMMAEVAGAGGIAAQASGSLGKAADTMTQNQNSNQLNQQKGEDICDSQKEDTGNDSGSDGVPVIEQPGALLGNTRTIAKVTTQTRHISSQTCKLTEKILKIQTDWWKKVSEDDPEAAKKAKGAVEKEAKDYKDFMKKGGKSPDDVNSQEKMAPTIESLIKKAEKAGRNDFMSKLENSKVSQKIKDTLIKAFDQQNAIEDDEGDADYKAGTASTEGFDADSFVNNPPKGSAFWEGFMTLAEPRNNLAGQYILQLQEKEKIVSKYAANAEKTWQTFQIMPKYGKCLKPVTYNGVTSCAEWEIETPAKLVADTASTLNDSKVNMTIATDQAGEEDGKNSVEGITQEVNGIGPDDVAVEDEASPTSKYGKGSFFDGMKEICGLVPSVCEKLTGGLDGGNQQEEEPTQTFEAPLPTITMKNEGTTNTDDGLKKTKISWTTTNAVSCTTDNDWVSYSLNNKATTSPAVMKPQDDDIETGGNFEIYHPAIFSYKVSSSGQTGSISQTADNSFNTSGGTLTQTITFRPNIAGLSAKDIVFLWLNGLSVSIDASASEDEAPTRTDINARLSSAIDLLIQKGTPNGVEFSKYNKRTAFDSLILSRNTNIFTSSNEYRMTCYNEDGKSTSRSTRVEFFR